MTTYHLIIQLISISLVLLFAIPGTEILWLRKNRENEKFENKYSPINTRKETKKDKEFGFFTEARNEISARLHRVAISQTRS